MTRFPVKGRSRGSSKEVLGKKASAWRGARTHNPTVQRRRMYKSHKCCAQHLCSLYLCLYISQSLQDRDTPSLTRLSVIMKFFMVSFTFFSAAFSSESLLLLLLAAFPLTTLVAAWAALLPFETSKKGH